MFTVMRDLVILPTSQTVIDRSTIKSHAKDSFNRMPFSIKDVIPGECFIITQYSFNFHLQ